MRGKRIIAFVLCACALLALLPMAALADITTDIIEGEIVGSNTITEVNGAANATVLLNNKAAQGYIIDYITTESNGLITDVTIKNPPEDGEIKINAQTKKNIFVSLSVNTQKNAKVYKDQEILIYFVGESEPLRVPFNLKKTSLSDEDKAMDEQPTETESPNPNSTLNAALMLDSTGIDGLPVPAPSGNAGDRVKIRLPLTNRNLRNEPSSSGSKLSAITVTPVLSATLDSFPFVIEEVDYSRKLPDMRAGTKQELVYDFKISSKATSGVKEVKFNAVYYNGAKETYETATFSVFVNVIKGADPANGGITDEDGNLITTTPKLIIESYEVKPLPKEEQEGQENGRLFAGDEFELTFRVRNTSDEEAIDNIQITLENSAGAILPAEGGSNSLYIKQIDKGGSEEKTIKLQSIPDAEAKSHTLAVNFSYESGKTQKSYTAVENLTLPIMQRMRVKMDDPVIYESLVMPGSSVGVYFSLYNMGKSTIYNCMVDVEGEGLKMEESYFGGNISAGGSMRADFNIVASTPGEIEGNIVITYEDVYGEQTVEKKPFTLSVMEEQSYDDPAMSDDPSMMEPGMEVMGGEGMPSQGLPWWGIALICAGGLAAVILVLVQVRKRRRKKELEDV